MDIKKFLETLCKLLSDQEGIKLNVTITPNGSRGCSNCE